MEVKINIVFPDDNSYTEAKRLIKDKESEIKILYFYLGAYGNDLVSKKYSFFPEKNRISIFFDAKKEQVEILREKKFKIIIKGKDKIVHLNKSESGVSIEKRKNKFYAKEKFVYNCELVDGALILSNDSNSDTDDFSEEDCENEISLNEDSEKKNEREKYTKKQFIKKKWHGMFKNGLIVFAQLKSSRSTFGQRR